MLLSLFNVHLLIGGSHEVEKVFVLLRSCDNEPDTRAEREGILTACIYSCDVLLYAA